MSQAEVIRTEPYIKYYTDEEINKMCIEYASLLEQGKDEEADILSNEIPILPKSAQIMKRMMGIESVIASGINLYEVVQEYGYEWLER